MRFFTFFFVFICFHSFGGKNPSVSFETNEDTSSIFIYAKVDGVVSLFLFDNASQKTILFVDDAYNLNDAKKISLFDSDEKRTEAYLKFDEVEIPNLAIRYKSTIVLMKEIPLLFKEKNVRGIIGADIINNYDWDIDFQSLKISKLTKKQKSNNDFFEIQTYLDKSKIVSADILFGLDTLSFQLDLGYNSVISTALTSAKIENISFKKYAFGYSIAAQNSIDTTFIGIDTINIGNMLINNIPINYSVNEKSNLLGVSFFKPFGRMLILNSSNKILLPLTDKYVYKADKVKIKDGIVVSQLMSINDKAPSVLGKSDREIESSNGMTIISTSTYRKMK